MNRFQAYMHRMSAEEKINTLTHLLSLVGTFFAAWYLLPLSLAGGVLVVIGTVLFFVGMTMMFASSTFYHAVTNSVHKARLRILDHISIYVMIAGSYSLICMSVVGGKAGWILFVFLWTCVLVGVAAKITATGKHPRLSLLLYLAMGWVALLILRPMWLNMPHAAFWWILAEGVCYTLGTYFFNGDEQHAYWHAVWHVFTTLGAFCHTIATWLILADIAAV